MARTGHRGERKKGKRKGRKRKKGKRKGRKRKERKREGRKKEEKGKRHVERTEKKNPEVYLRVLKGIRKFKVFLSHLCVVISRLVCRCKPTCVSLSADLCTVDYALVRCCLADLCAVLDGSGDGGDNEFAISVDGREDHALRLNTHHLARWEVRDKEYLFAD